MLSGIILQNEKYFTIFLLLNLIFIMLFSISMLAIFLKYNYSKDKKLQEITKYIEEINNKNYKLNINDNTEDELSILNIQNNSYVKGNGRKFEKR